MISTAHGTIALVRLEGDAVEAAATALHADERAHAGTLTAHRRREWIAGRTALRSLVVSELPLLSDDRGAPRAPAGRVVSVSHKGALGAALVALDDGARIGLDVEVAAPPRLDIAARILTARELAVLPDRGRAVTLRFAIKEAIYKAVDPFVRRYVGFQEVELEFRDSGIVVTSELGLAIEAAWLEHDGHWIATARARR